MDPHMKQNKRCTQERVVEIKTTQEHHEFWKSQKQRTTTRV